MTNNEHEPFEDEDGDFDNVEFNLDKIKSKIPTYSSEKLCEMVVCDRYFGCYNEMSLACMEELAARRIKGDKFDFEDYINKSMAELPVLNFDIPDLTTTLRGLVGVSFRK